MFGGGGSVSAPAADAAAFSGVQMLLNIISLLTDRQRVAADIERWLEAGKKASHALAELKKHEQELLRRERQAIEQEQALAKREDAVTERERQAENQLRRAEEQRASIAELKAEVKRGLSAAA
jgi:hypothetical protein